MAVKFLLYSRWHTFIQELTGVEKASCKQEINAEDTLEISVPYPLAKGDRILWRDELEWHEHVVCKGDEEHSKGLVCKYSCEPALLQDLDLAYINLCVMNDVRAEVALGLILGQTTWQVGIVDDFGTNSMTVEDMTAYEGLIELAGIWGCEIQASFEVDDYGVTVRKVNLRKQIGASKGARFEYGRNMGGVKKRILKNPVYTAVYGYGKTLETETDGIKDRLTFASINGGVPYVADEEAKMLWGLPDGKGGAMHAFGVYRNSDCEDAQQLLDETRAHLAQNSTPAVSYTTEIPFAQLSGSRLGDVVQVIDTCFTPHLRLEARIGALERDLLTGETSSATFGTVISTLPDVYARLFAAARTAGTAPVTAASIMEGMNTLYETGGSYICQTADGGIITANVPLDSTGNPVSTTGTLLATRLSNGRVYMATSVDSTGSLVWSEGVSTQTLILSDGTNSGALTIKDGSLYWNETLIG